jgi:hypothetical protein
MHPLRSNKKQENRSKRAAGILLSRISRIVEMLGKNQVTAVQAEGQDEEARSI